MERIPYIIIVVGMRNSGKTYYTQSLFGSSSQRKILVCDTFDHPSYAAVRRIDLAQLAQWKPQGEKSIRRVVIEDFEVAFAEISAHFRDGWLVLEDAGKYSMGDLTKNLRRLVIDSKQLGMDITLMYHSLSQVPPKLYQFANAIVLFKTNEDPSQFKNKTPYYPEVLAAFNDLQTAAKYEHRLIQIT